MNAVQVAGDVAARGGDESGIDLDLSGSQRPSPTAVAPYHDGTVQFALADQFADEAVHPRLDPGDYAFANVRNDLGMNGMHRAGGDADVAETHAVEFLDQHDSAADRHSARRGGSRCSCRLRVRTSRSQPAARAAACFRHGGVAPGVESSGAFPACGSTGPRTGQGPAMPPRRDLTSQAIFRHGSPRRKGRIRACRRPRLPEWCGPRALPPGRRPSCPSWR